jgi:hypothetical protein
MSKYLHGYLAWAHYCKPTQRSKPNQTMTINPRTQILALVAPKRFRYRSTTPLIRRQLATQPPPRANLDPPLSASTQDLLNRLAKEAAKNNAPGATVRPGGSALGQDGNVGGGKPYVGSVGPFGLGVGLGSNIRNKDWKKWRELGLGGKGTSRVLALCWL